MSREVGSLGKGCCRRVPANDSDPTAVQKEDEAGGRTGESWGRRRGGGAPSRRGPSPRFPGPRPARVTWASLPVHTGNLRLESVTPLSAPLSSPLQPSPSPTGFLSAGRGLARFPSTAPSRSNPPPRAAAEAAASAAPGWRLAQARASPGRSHWACSVAAASRCSALAPGAAAPAPARPSLPRRGLARLPPPLGLPGAGLPARRRRRRRGRAGRRAVMWRDSLCTAAGYAPGRRAAAALGSLLSEAAAMMEV